jgi:hypothetical protein
MQCFFNETNRPVIIQQVEGQVYNKITQNPREYCVVLIFTTGGHTRNLSTRLVELTNLYSRLPRCHLKQ